MPRAASSAATSASRARGHAHDHADVGLIGPDPRERVHVQDRRRQQR